MSIKKILQIIIAIVICEVAGIIGALFTTQAIPKWYSTLRKPFLSPPNWIFGPVWTLLYLLMGIAAYLVWQAGWKKKEVKVALGIFALQLFLNALWSIVFFGFQSPFWALLNIIAMWLAILATMFSFYKISKLAMWLLAPYLLWVSFASYLNSAIWVLN